MKSEIIGSIGKHDKRAGKLAIGIFRANMGVDIDATSVL
jgi:hypothetical protein